MYALVAERAWGFKCDSRELGELGEEERIIFSRGQVHATL